MDTSMIDRSSSEGSATSKVFGKFHTWMIENRGTSLESPSNQTLFLRKIITILNVYSPISTWGTGRLGDFVKERSHDSVKLRKLLTNEPSRLPQGSFGIDRWDLRVVPLALQTPGPAIQGIFFESEFNVDACAGRLPTKCLEKRLFLDRNATIVGVDLHSEVCQGERCPPHQVDVGIADDPYLIEIFGHSPKYLDLILTGLDRSLQEAIGHAETRVREQTTASSVLRFGQMAFKHLSKE